MPELGHSLLVWRNPRPGRAPIRVVPLCIETPSRWNESSLWFRLAVRCSPQTRPRGTPRLHHAQSPRLTRQGDGYVQRRSSGRGRPAPRHGHRGPEAGPSELVQGAPPGSALNGGKSFPCTVDLACRRLALPTTSFLFSPRGALASPPLDSFRQGHTGDHGRCGVRFASTPRGPWVSRDLLLRDRTRLMPQKP